MIPTKNRRFKLKEIETGAVRFLTGPYVRLGDVNKKTTTITILRTGSFNHPKYGQFDITRELLDGFVRNFNARTYGQDIQMDISHKPEKGNAGDIVRLFVERNRLRGIVEWSDYGISSIKKKQFKYVSADFSENWIDNEDGKAHGPVLFGAGLVTRPFIKRMEPVQLSEEGGSQVITFINPSTLDHFKSEEKNMKKLLEALKKKLQALKLSEGHILSLLKLFEDTGKQFEDNTDGLNQLYTQVESAGVQLAEALAGQNSSTPVTIQLGDISVGGASSGDDIEAIVAKKLADAQAAVSKKLADDKSSLDNLHKTFNEAIDAAEGIDEATVKTLKEASDLIVPSMTEAQVLKLAENQINLGNQMAAQKKLSGMGYQTNGPAGSVHIQLVDDTSSMQLQETINTGLRGSASSIRLALTEDKKLNPFAQKVLMIFDSLNAKRLHEEAKQLAGGETGIADTNFPMGVQRTVIREALSDLRILELVNGMTDPTAQATTQIPYEVRDTSEVLNDGVVFEGQGIPGASISQEMDLAYILPRKLAMKLSNEVIHFSRSSVIDWDAYGRNVESNARVMRELIARFIANEYQRASDSYLAAAVPAEVFDAQMPASVIKTINFPIVRPHQVYDLKGNAVGNPENPIAVTLNGTAIDAYDGSNTQAGGTYYRVTNYNLGYIQFVSELGAPVSPADTGVNTVGYSYATNVAKFDLDFVSADITLERHLNGLLQKIGSRKAVLQGDRFITPDFMLMSPTLNDTATNAEQFTAAGKRVDANVSAEGDLTTVKGTPAFGTNAPGVDLGDERILIGQRGTCTYTVAKPFVTGTPFEAVDAQGRPTGQKVAYGEEYSAVKVPKPIRNRLTSVIAYSVAGRAAV